MPDLSSLALTDEDLSEYNGIGGASFDEPWVQERLRELADAQLRKAAWMIQAWLKEEHPNSGQSITWKRWQLLERALLAAGIPKEG